MSLLLRQVAGATQASSSRSGYRVARQHPLTGHGRQAFERGGQTPSTHPRSLSYGFSEMEPPAFGSRAGRFSQCGLHGGVKHAEKPRAVLVGQRSWSAGIRSELAEVPRYLATDERIAYIRLRPLFAGRGDDPRSLFETA